ncbi:hypothetical protein [Streptomyces sp. KO7888]|nr:hypothetical protein [Streptomyces sp. KO7888]
MTDGRHIRFDETLAIARTVNGIQRSGASWWIGGAAFSRSLWAWRS